MAFAELLHVVVIVGGGGEYNDDGFIKMLLIDGKTNPFRQTNSTLPNIFTQYLIGWSSYLTANTRILRIIMKS